MSGYQDIVDDTIRIKNRYKSLFRKEGRMITGTALYVDENLLDGLEREEFKFIGKHLYQQLAAVKEIKSGYIKEIKGFCRKLKEIKYLKTLPGVGDIQAAKIVAQVIDPDRFKDKYKYFSYCGLVRHRQISGDRVYGDKKIYGNRVLKCVYKMAAESVLKGNSGLRKYYDNLRSKGTGHKNAKNAVSRKIAAISLALWKNGEEYRDDVVINSLIK